MSRVKPPATPRLPLDAVPRMGTSGGARTPRTAAPKAERMAPPREAAPREVAPAAAPRIEAPRIEAPGPRLPDRPGRWKLLLRRRRPLLRPLALLCLVAMIGIGVAGAVQSLGRSAGQAPGLDTLAGRLGMTVQGIEIAGRQKTPERAIYAALGVRQGDPILGVDLQAARARVEAINWVQSATVERRLPATLVVSITERSPFAIWQNKGEFVLIDRQGKEVRNASVDAFMGQLLLLVGAGAEAAAVGIVEALATQPGLATRVVAAVRVGERRWNLRMTNGADVMLPEGHERQALARLAELQASQSLLDRPLALVDLRLPDRLVVRPAPPPAAAPAAATPRKT